MTIDPNLIIFYVGNPEKSAMFYGKILKRDPIEVSASFALFQLNPDFRLGLWSKQEVLPKAETTGGGCELTIHLPTEDEVTNLFDQWLELKINIIQSPIDMDFGYSFVALDPDLHRIRVYHLKSNK